MLLLSIIVVSLGFRGVSLGYQGGDPWISMRPLGYEWLLNSIIGVSLRFLGVSVGFLGVSFEFHGVPRGVLDTNKSQGVSKVINLYYKGILGVVWCSMGFLGG